MTVTAWASLAVGMMDSTALGEKVCTCHGRLSRREHREPQEGFRRNGNQKDEGTAVGRPGKRQVPTR